MREQQFHFKSSHNIDAISDWLMELSDESVEDENRHNIKQFQVVPYGYHENTQTAFRGIVLCDHLVDE